MRHLYHVYILASHLGTLYVGSTGNLHLRLAQHRSGNRAGFTTQYRTHKLVYAESTHDIYAAREREQQIKRWSRAKKTALIESINPYWEDLGKGL